MIAILAISGLAAGVADFSNPITLPDSWAPTPLFLLDTPPGGDTLPWPIKDRKGDFYTDDDDHGLDLDDPSVIKKSIEYDPKTGKFVVRERMGSRFYRAPQTLGFDEYMEQESKRASVAYWKQRAKAASLVEESGGLSLPFDSSSLIPEIEIRSRGNIELIFGGNFQNIDNPTLPEQARRQGSFDFDMNINLSVTGKIGDYMKLTTNYNTQATFEFENEVKLQHTGRDDQILQNVEAGNVSFPLPTTLITGSQSLFGLKTKLKFGRLMWSSVLSQNKSSKENIRIEGGAQARDFSIEVDKYDENRHFFLGHYFRDNYDQWMSSLPIVASPIRVERIEVWVTNANNAIENTRDIVGFADIGEQDPDRLHDPTNTITPGAKVPDNKANSLYSRLTKTTGTRDLGQVTSILEGQLGLDDVKDFSKTRARKLTPSEYVLYPELGFVSLNLSLQPDDILAVAYEYTHDGEVHQVGEFTQDVGQDSGSQKIVWLKMLKSTSAQPRLPIWDLMMKNVYSLGAFQVSADDFRLDITYRDPGGGVKSFLPKGNVQGIRILQLLNLDRLNNRHDPFPDGQFDFVAGRTINPANGRVLFPVVEPFGDHLRSKFDDPAIANQFVFDILYDSTKTVAQQFPQFNRYTIQGTYKSSSSSDIYLGAFNIPRGSVTVKQGGQQLTEGRHFTIDYNLGRVKIIDEGVLNSGIPIDISYEDHELFGFQTKTMIGNRFDYWVNDDITIGATWLKLYERPFTQKVGVGEDPINNSMYGLDFSLTKELPFLTRVLNLLPIYASTEPSSISVQGEVAAFDPSHSKAINSDDKEGIIYIDDFEGSKSSYDLKFPFTSWTLASTPRDAKDATGRMLFPEAALFDDVRYGYNRGKLVWYNLDPTFQNNSQATPDCINDDARSNHYVRIINEREIFPQKQSPNNLLTTISTFDVAFHPNLRGPYNYEASVAGEPGISSGINPDGTLKDPRSRWGGVMRSIETNDFEAANIEFIEFWLMDPFLGQPGQSAELYFNLGNVSEDVLKDSKKFFENGLPRPGSSTDVDQTTWGDVPRIQAITNAFDTDPNVLVAHDVGYDGLSDANERIRRSDFIAALDAMRTAGDLTQDAYDSLVSDPSSDNFRDYFDAVYDNSGCAGILRRYRHFDGAEGNTADGVVNDKFSHGSILPNTEDLNHDNTLNETESYFQYRVELHEQMDVNHPYITDVLRTNPVEFPNDDTSSVKWYHFKIPIESYDHRVGAIRDFKSIRFMRMFVTGVQDSLMMRFARLELVRNQWRRYRFDLRTPGELIVNDDNNNVNFNVSSVSIEEDAGKEPIPYAEPPGVDREEFIGGTSNEVVQQNEQSMLLEVCGLPDGDARAVYKVLNFDFRKYENLELFIHAEEFNGGGATPLQDDQLEAFIRLGADFTENYYEYALPLKITDPANLSGSLEANKEVIWPAANKMEVVLAELIQAKQDRNAAGIAPTKEYPVDLGGGKRITVVGNPDIGNAKIAMIGLRNIEDAGGTGEPLCAEVWVNELRLKGIDERGGVAAILSSDIKLSDLGNLRFALGFHTIGFGQIEQKVDERFQDNFFQYDIATGLELGKLLPKSLKLRLPMHAQISKSFSRPQYDPYDFDVELNEKLNNLPAGISRKEYLASVQDFTSLKSLNFSNVRVDKGTGKAKPWNISNFNGTYAFNQSFRSNPSIAHDLVRTNRVGLGYNFSTRAKYVQPFKNLFKPSQKVFQLIRDFNLNPVPTKLAFRTDLKRQYGELVMRDIFGQELQDTSYNKFFDWDRFYDLRWDLTKSIQLDFKAANKARVDEPAGKINTNEKRDTVLTNLLNFGRTTHYNHSVDLSYKVPFDKFPLLNWVTARASYGGDYDWRAAPLNLDSLGNTIENAQNIRLDGDLNFRTLYNKVPFIKKMNQTKRRGGGRGNIDRNRTGGDNTEGDTEDDKEKKEDKGPNPILKGAVDVVTALKQVSVNYSRNRSTYLPGYTPNSRLLGMSSNFTAPGLDFIFGMQPDTSWLSETAAPNGWITNARTLNFQFAQDMTENFDAKVKVEPAKDMRLDINFKRNVGTTFTEVFRYDPKSGRYVNLNPSTRGTFTVSFLAIRTAFDRLDTATNFTPTYQKFLAERIATSGILGGQNPHSIGPYIQPNPPSPNDTLNQYAYGYGPYMQEILIPSLIAAYTGRKSADVPVNVLKNRPAPNWRFTYTGLSKVSLLKKYFNSISITHGYNSTLTVSEFKSSFQYDDPLTTGFPGAIDPNTGNYYALMNIPNVQITEQFTPLIGIDVSMKNSLSARFEFKKGRRITLSLVDYQLIEQRSREFTIGSGYRLKGLLLPFIKIRNKPLKLENDLNFRFDLSLRDDRTINYGIDQGTAETTRGTLSVNISPSVDYVVNDRLNIRMFFDRRITEPHTTAAYPIRNTNAGVAVRFTLQ